MEKTTYAGEGVGMRSVVHRGVLHMVLVATVEVCVEGLQKAGTRAMV